MRWLSRRIPKDDSLFSASYHKTDDHHNDQKGNGPPDPETGSEEPPGTELETQERQHIAHGHLIADGDPAPFPLPISRRIVAIATTHGGSNRFRI